MRRFTRIALVVSLAALANGCLHSNLNDNWGKSQEAQIVWQTENPEAPTTADGPEGLDPNTANEVAERYYKSQERQPHRKIPSVSLEID